MKKFNFKLESVLKYRGDKVTQAKDSLNQVLKIKNEKELAISDTQNTINNLINEKEKGKIKASDLQIKNNHINFLNDEIVRLNEEKKQIVEIENIRRVKLTKAMKDEKVMEKLKEKQKYEHNEIQKKEEGIMLDEIGLRISQKSKNTG